MVRTAYKLLIETTLRAYTEGKILDTAPENWKVLAQCTHRQWNASPMAV
jgi:hypothetical protein